VSPDGENISLATPFSNRVDSAIIKIDHSFNANNLLTGRYYIGDSDQSFPLALVGGGLVPAYNTANRLASSSFPFPTSLPFRLPLSTKPASAGTASPKVSSRRIAASIQPLSH